MGKKYEKLIDELRVFEKVEREYCESEGYYDNYSHLISAAAYAIETMSDEIKAYSADMDMLTKRLSHLLQSKTIREYDKKEPMTGEYELDIADLDCIMNRCISLEKERAAADAPVYVATREDILRRAAECVSGQRQQDYGTPEDNFATIARLWSAYRGVEFDAVDVAIMMALLKIARISSGHGAEDSFVDLAGYAACGGAIWPRAQLEHEIERGGGNG